MQTQGDLMTKPPKPAQQRAGSKPSKGTRRDRRLKRNKSLPKRKR